MVVEGVGGVVCGADDADFEFFEEAVGGDFGFGEFCVGDFPDFIGGIGGEEGVDAEVLAELHVDPVVHGVAEGVGDGFGEGLEFIARGGVAGDAIFIDAVGAEEAPFVVVVFEPHFGDVLPAVVGGDFGGGEVVVVVDDGERGGDFVEEAAGGFGLEEEVFV